MTCSYFLIPSSMVSISISGHRAFILFCLRTDFISRYRYPDVPQKTVVACQPNMRSPLIFFSSFSRNFFGKYSISWWRPEFYGLTKEGKTCPASDKSWTTILFSASSTLGTNLLRKNHAYCILNCALPSIIDNSLALLFSPYTQAAVLPRCSCRQSSSHSRQT